MADFCKQCSEEIFGDDFHDLEKLMPKEKYAEGKGAGALCEGCGPIVVDIYGRCCSPDCTKNHGAVTSETEHGNKT